MAERGDLVEQGGERGVICCLDPLVMVPVDFHCYVPVRGDAYTVREKGHPVRPAPAPVLDRIRRYVEREWPPQPTGG